MSSDRFLLDTQILIWSMLDERERLSPRVVSILEAQEDIWVSVGSVWEITIKMMSGKIRLPIGGSDSLFQFAEDAGVQILPVRRQHLTALEKLPSLHKDPFDRLIVAQAVSEGMQLISSDRKLRDYPVDIIS